MRILFFIYVRGHGSGGHYHSLNHISQSIGEQNEVKIISFGTGFSKILELNPNFSRHIFFNGCNILTLRNGIKKIIKTFQPEIFHCFDDSSYNIVRLLINSKKNKIILNKCGGPNYDFYPYAKNLILFSQENLNWFHRFKKFEDCNIHLIPNRVRGLIENKEVQQIHKNDNEFNFIRISRIGIEYKKSIFDSIHLINYLLSIGFYSVRLYVIGVVQNYTILREIEEHPLVDQKKVFLLTESNYTTEASKMLYLADAVIGTGRGLMEAASLGKPILTINSEDTYPVLLTSSNFMDAFKTNFSERNIFKSYDTSVNLKNIMKLISDKSFYFKQGFFAKKVFNEYFDIEKVSGAYLKVYQTAKLGDRKILSDFKPILRSWKWFYIDYLRFRKSKH